MITLGDIKELVPKDSYVDHPAEVVAAYLELDSKIKEAIVKGVIKPNAGVLSYITPSNSPVNLLTEGDITSYQSGSGFTVTVQTITQVTIKVPTFKFILKVLDELLFNTTIELQVGEGYVSLGTLNGLGEISVDIIEKYLEATDTYPVSNTHYFRVNGVAIYYGAFTDTQGSYVRQTLLLD